MRCSSCGRAVQPCFPTLWCMPCANLIRRLRSRGFDFFGTDYKVAVTTIQILGYVIAKFFGIKLISELKKERRFKFFVCSAVAAEAALVGFGLLAPPFNVAAMFLNGLSLGCMWGVIFSFIEGPR